jgi:hypothetical protein
LLTGSDTRVTLDELTTIEAPDLLASRVFNDEVDQPAADVARL